MDGGGAGCDGVDNDARTVERRLSPRICSRVLCGESSPGSSVRGAFPRVKGRIEGVLD